MSDAFVRYVVGDALTVLRSMPDASVDCLVTSPPYPWMRSYLPDGHPDKARELGQENDPAEALEALLVFMDEAWRVLADHATFWVNLGQSHSGSGGSGGDYDEGGMREGQARFQGTGKISRGGVLAMECASENRRRGHRHGWPLDQSICWIPELFGASLAYGGNLLTGTVHRQWVTRPPVTWAKPNPPIGQLTRKFRTATELVVYGGKQRDHFFDLDAVREEREPYTRHSNVLVAGGEGGNFRANGGIGRRREMANNAMGAPPKNWWVIPTEGYPDAHYAVMPSDLVVRPIKAGCPERVCLGCARPVVRLFEGRYLGEPDDRTRTKPTGRLTSVDHPPEKGWERVHELVGEACGCPDGPGETRPGVVLDPFAGTFTVGAVAFGHGRSCIGIDLDSRNAELARRRVGMWLEVEGEDVRRPTAVVETGDAL